MFLRGSFVIRSSSIFLRKNFKIIFEITLHKIMSVILFCKIIYYLWELFNAGDFASHFCILMQKKTYKMQKIWNWPILVVTKWKTKRRRKKREENSILIKLFVSMGPLNATCHPEYAMQLFSHSLINFPFNQFNWMGLLWFNMCVFEFARLATSVNSAWCYVADVMVLLLIAYLFSYITQWKGKAFLGISLT